MIKIDRNENPIFTNYDEDSVKHSLKIDFFKKCYLCEEVTRHFEVDHFYPQKYYPHLINSYDNLFYICQKCNKVKPKIINTNSNNEILNCCDINVENYIKLSLNIKKCKVDIEQIRQDKALDNKIQETIKLLDRIYNGTNSQSNSCEDLKQEIITEIANFKKLLGKYQTKLKNAVIDEIKEKLDIQSSYSTFKRWIVKDNKKFELFQQYL